MPQPLFDQVDAILANPEMSQDIVDCLGAEANDQYVRLIQRVEGRFESSPNYNVVRQFIQDHSKLRDDELVTLFEFIYSSLINNFKGELAELFARPRMRDFATTLGMDDAQSLFGPEIRARGMGGKGGWLKGADGLLCHRTGSRLQIVAVVEIKAMQRPLPRVIAQIVKHVVRMQRGGVQIADERFAPDAIDAVLPDGRVAPLVQCAAAAVTALIVRPWIASEDGAILRHPDRPNVWLAELRYPQKDITEAAYRFATWYFSRIGPKVFYLPGEEAAGRRPAPHPEDTLEENGSNSFIAALFGVWRRDLFQPRDPDQPRGGRRTPGDTFLWLYNSLCGGSSGATVDDIYFPPFEPDPAYEARRQKRIQALDAFANGRAADALENLPDPSGQRDLWSRRREWLMLARVRARAGDPSGAREALEAARSEPLSSNLAVPLEIAAVESLVFLSRGQLAEARQSLKEGLAALDRLRHEIQEHERQRWDFPADIDALSMHTAVVDLAIALALTGEPDRAADLLHTLTGVQPFESERVLHEPALRS